MQHSYSTQFAQALYESTNDTPTDAVDQLLKRAAAMLKRDGATHRIEEVLEAYAQYHDQQRGILPVIVESKQPLGQEMIEKITQWVTREYPDSTPVITQKENPSVIGGMKVRIRDQVFDYSVAGFMRQLQQAISN